MLDIIIQLSKARSCPRARRLSNRQQQNSFCEPFFCASTFWDGGGGFNYWKLWCAVHWCDKKRLLWLCWDMKENKYTGEVADLKALVGPQVGLKMLTIKFDPTLFRLIRKSTSREHR